MRDLNDQNTTTYTLLTFQCLQAQPKTFPNGNPNDLCLLWCMICNRLQTCKLQPTIHNLLLEPTIFLVVKGRDSHSHLYIRCCRQCFAQLVDVFSDLSQKAIICLMLFLAAAGTMYIAGLALPKAKGQSGRFKAQVDKVALPSKENQRSSRHEIFVPPSWQGRCYVCGERGLQPWYALVRSSESS